MTDKPNPWLGLKDNPIIILFGFCAATAAATAAVYEKLVIPYNVKVLETQIADLTRQIASIPNLEKSLREKDSTLAVARKDNAALQQRVFELSMENVFSPDDPYPKTFRKVRIGDLFAKLEEAYPGNVKKDDPDNTWASVKADDFFFSSVTYYYEEGQKPPRVTTILFHLNFDRDTLTAANAASPKLEVKERLAQSRSVRTQALKTQLVERYGPGIVVKRTTQWRVRGVLLSLDDTGPFTISRP